MFIDLEWDITHISEQFISCFETSKEAEELRRSKFRDEIREKMELLAPAHEFRRKRYKKKKINVSPTMKDIKYRKRKRVESHLENDLDEDNIISS